MPCTELTKNNLVQALKLVWEVFLEYDAIECSLEGVEEFKRFLDYDSITGQLRTGMLRFWGYWEEELLGVIALRNYNHICLLFVKSQFHRQGIARRLFDTAKHASMQQPNVEHITVHSSSYATEAYRRLGFVDTGPKQVKNGITYTPMVYHLNRALVPK